MCGMLEVRNAKSVERQKNVGRTPEERRAESEDGKEKLKEHRKNAAQRVIWKL